MQTSYSIFSPADGAVTFSFGNVISDQNHRTIISMSSFLEQKSIHGVKDLVAAYSSLTVMYDAWLVRKNDLSLSARQFVIQQLEQAFRNASASPVGSRSAIKIPVCYDSKFSLDLHLIADIKKISPEEIIRVHTSRTYNVFMIGFLPGFGYMASVDEKIAVPRKEKPRSLIEAGSVGIAGIQTGIYPVNSPGGWQIIGRTPLKMFDKTLSAPSRLQAGDSVDFYQITSDEFDSLLKENK